MDYRKIIEDLTGGLDLADAELRLAAAASIRELLEQKMSLTSELTLAKKCLGENEAAYESLKVESKAAVFKALGMSLFPFIPGMKLSCSAEDENTMYLDMPDGPRLVFHEGKYTGYVAEVDE